LTADAPVVARGGPVLTMNGSATDAVAWRGDRVVALGEEAHALATTDGARTIDLAGRCALPGFVDPHHHLGVAVLYRGAVACEPTATRSIADIAAALRSAASRLPAGQWVVGTGYDAWRLAERRHPTREDLDQACPDHPVMLMNYSHHQCVASSRALELAGIGRDTPEPFGGRIVRGRKGEPSGRLIETALHAVERLARPALLERDLEGFAARLHRYEDDLFAHGIVRIADATVPPDLEAVYADLHRDGRMRMPLVMMPIASEGYLVPPRSRLAGSVTGEGDETLRVGPMKLVLDGGEDCAMCLTPTQLLGVSLRTALRTIARASLDPLRAALQHAGGHWHSGHFHTGFRFYTGDAEIVAMATAAVERGFAIAMHAMGNEAVRQALVVVEAIRDQHPDHPPPRIEHAMAVEPRHVERLAATGALVVVQPAFVGIPAAGAIPPLPFDPFPLKMLHDGGVALSGSSDAPVIGFAPLEAVRAGVTRRGGDGPAVAPAQALDVETLLAMYTREAARACGSLDVCGTLEPGKRADVVVLSSDPRAGAPESLGALAVDETIVGGRTMFRRDDAGRSR
jgi:predicted amidohydrolase YtcJ